MTMPAKLPITGGQAKSETGQASMKNAGSVLGLAVPFKMSSMVGKSGVRSTTIGANNNYDCNALVNWINGFNNANLTFNITVTGTIVGQAGKPCLTFPSTLKAKQVNLTINANCYVSGRGGAGASKISVAGGNGMDGINNAIGSKLHLTNNGVIQGGGGGGSAGGLLDLRQQPPRMAGLGGGGGGAGYGAGGAGGSTNAQDDGKAGTLTAGGAPGTLGGLVGSGGAGGAPGAAGGAGSSNGTTKGGAGGYALRGAGTVKTKIGTTHGTVQ